MNTVSSQVALFTDDKVECDGPKVKGPTLFDWLESNGHTVGPNDFSTLVQFGTYLRWVYDHVVERLPSNVKVKLHVAKAQKVTEATSGLYQLTSSTGTLKDLSAVVLAQATCPEL